MAQCGSISAEATANRGSTDCVRDVVACAGRDQPLSNLIVLVVATRANGGSPQSTAAAVFVPRQLNPVGRPSGTLHLLKQINGPTLNMWPFTSLSGQSNPNIKFGIC